LGGVLVAPAAVGQTVDLTRILKGIETRYNSAQTLEVNFTYTYTFRNRKTTEKGTLFLRKPGKMRWQYTEPAGKLFVSDGNFIWSFDPEEQRAEKEKFKETEDMRAPLAFLLGRLDFQKDFGQFRTSPQGADVSIVATPRSDKMPYTEVSFVAAPDFTIRRLIVKGQDNSVMDFSFEGEKRNPPVAEAMFRFVPPRGVEVVDLTN
jgi:outer membrane lipoprotein carrier protein